MFNLTDKKITWFAVAVVIFGLVLAYTSMLDEAIIVDEIPHIGAGYSYIVKQDMRLNPEHPPLIKDLAGIPMAFMGLSQDVFATKFWTEDLNGQWNFGRYLIFNSGNNPDSIMLAARTPLFLFYILACLITFSWATKLYGKVAGLIALILLALSPTVMTHARFVTTDMGALFGILAGTFFYLRYLESPSRKSMLIASAIFGVALLCKFSTFLLIPYLGLLSIIWGFVHGGSWGDKFTQAIKWGFRSVAVFIVGFVIVVWPVYLFHTHNYSPAHQYSDTKTLLSSFGKRWMADPVVWASDKPILRGAAQYGLGFLMVVQRSAGGNTTYFMGEVERFGWRHYFPIVYFIKEPLAWWGLVVIALLTVVVRTMNISIKPSRLGPWIKNHFHEFAILVWLAVYWATSIQSTLNIGVRHLLPTFPFAMILVAGQSVYITQWLQRVRPQNWKKMAIVITLLLGWYAFENVSVYPYYLTYFNQVAGGPSGGYRYVVDSNLDWGQDLRRLDKWVRENNIGKIELDYFGWSDPYYYLKDRYLWLSANKYVDAQDFRNRNQSDGWIAVSASFLQGSQGASDQPNAINYSTWLPSFTPVTVIGNSIFVFHIK